MRAKSRACGWAILAAYLLYGAGLPGVNAGGAKTAGGESQTYTVKKGETVGDIADRFLGSTDSVPELLKYNKIGNPLSVKEGTILAIPGELRTKALASFAAAEAALMETRQADCPRYATELYNKARKAFTEAQQALNETAYSKAESLCMQVTEQAREAIELAAKKAQIPLECTVTAVQGKAQMKLEGGNPWAPLKEGMKVAAGARLRTGADSRIEVTLPDGSKTQIGANAELGVSELHKDKRTNGTSTNLRLFLGEIFGRIEKSRTSDSTFTIDSGESATAIRGTDLRVNRHGNVTRVMTLDGAVAVYTGDSETRVPKDFGLIVEGRQAPGKTVALLPPPRVSHPGARKLTTASQKIAFAWEAAGDKSIMRHGKLIPGTYRLPRSTRYHLELATDPEINHTVHDVRIGERQFLTSVLSPGTYYWRISSLDADLLEGRWSEVGEIVVEQRLGIVAVPAAKPVESKGRQLVAPGTRLQVSTREELSSVTAYEISVNGAPFGPYSEDFSLDAPGEYGLQVRGVAADGETGSPEQIQLVVDGAAPTIELHAGSPFDHEKRGSVVNVTITAEDDSGVGEIETRMSWRWFRKYDGPLLLDSSRNYKLRVRAIDRLGNTTRAKVFRILRSE